MLYTIGEKVLENPNKKRRIITEENQTEASPDGGAALFTYLNPMKLVWGEMDRRWKNTWRISKDKKTRYKAGYVSLWHVR